MVDAFKALYVKKEVTYAVDAAPTLGTNAILTRNFSASPLIVDQLDRKLDSASRGALPTQPSNPRQQLSFEVELAGSGAAATVPAWMELLQGCAMAPPTTQAGQVQQKFAAVGANLSSLSCYHYVGNQLRKGVGARGDITAIDFTAGAFPFLAFALTALRSPYTPFATVAPPTPDFTRWIEPLEVNTANTQVVLDGFTPVMRSLKLQANAAVTVRNLVGSNYVQRGNHALRGKLLIEAPTVEGYNYFSKIRSGDPVDLHLTHGTTAGNIVGLTANNGQVTAIADQSEDDIAMFELDLQLNINTGQDDILIFTA